MEASVPNTVTQRMRRIVRLVAILKSLFADSIDLLEDASVNFLILLALDWNAQYGARVGMVWSSTRPPGVATLWTAWRKFTVPVPPPVAALAGRGWRACCKSVVRDHVRKLPTALRELDVSSVPIGSERRPCEYGYHRSELSTAFTRSDLIVGLGIALNEHGCGKRNLPANTGGAPRNYSLRSSLESSKDEFYECHITESDGRIRANLHAVSRCGNLVSSRED